MWVYHLAHYGMNNGYAAQLVYAHFIQAISQIYLHVYLIVRNQNKLRYKDIYGDSLLRLTSWMGQTPHHRPAKTVFSNVPSNSDWQKCEPVEIRAGWRGNPLASISVSQSCKEQLKIGVRRPVVWRLTFSGVGRMITCRRLNILCRVNTKGKWQIHQRINLLRARTLPWRGGTMTGLGIARHIQQTRQAPDLWHGVHQHRVPPVRLLCPAHQGGRV